MAFDSVDKDKSGHLSAKEIRGLLLDCGYTRCTEADIDRWIETVDKNEDGEISFEEFAAFLESRIEQS
ncbi:unnamed protein product [Trichobilharzia regenti]|nr:unnamed protein product [Trichobilharzia regenti]